MKWILVVLGCWCVAGSFSVIGELVAAVTGTQVPTAVYHLLNLAGLGTGIWLVLSYRRLHQARAAGDPESVAKAQLEWKIRAYPSFGLAFAALCAMVLYPAMSLARPKPTDLELRRLQEIPMEAAFAEDARLQEIRREFWAIQDRIGAPPSEVKEIGMKSLPAMQRMSLYWEDARSSFREGRVVETPERLLLEEDLVAKGLLKAESVAKARKDMAALARHEIVNADGETVAVTETMMEDGVRRAAQARKRVESLFERPSDGAK